MHCTVAAAPVFPDAIACSCTVQVVHVVHVQVRWSSHCQHFQFWQKLISLCMNNSGSHLAGSIASKFLRYAHVHKAFL